MLGSIYNKCLFGFVGVCSFAFADTQLPPPGEVYPPEEPYFTGPLLTSSATVLRANEGNIEPYIYAMDFYGSYNKDWDSVRQGSFYQYFFTVPIQVGVNRYCDVEIIPSVGENKTRGVSDFGVNDLPVGIELQLYEGGKIGIPIKLSILEGLPIGDYRGLDPDKLGTDIHGDGVFYTKFILAAAKEFHLKDLHHLRTRTNLIYYFSPPTHVNGYNTYGGAADTDGRVRPGNQFEALLGLEYSFTKKIAFACDFYFITAKRNKFVGNPGHNPDGSLATVGSPSMEQFSIAPALEYNFNSHVGLIGGAWFSLFGRNSGQFTSAVIALNWFIE